MRTSSEDAQAGTLTAPDPPTERIYPEFTPAEVVVTWVSLGALALLTGFGLTVDPLYGLVFGISTVVIAIGQFRTLVRGSVSLVLDDEGIGLRKRGRWIQFLAWSDFGGYRGATGWRKLHSPKCVELLRRDGTLAFWTEPRPAMKQPIHFAFLCRELDRRLPPRAAEWQAQYVRPRWLRPWMTESFCRRAMGISGLALVISVVTLIALDGVLLPAIQWVLLAILGVGFILFLAAAQAIAEIGRENAIREAALHRRLPDPVHEAMLDFLDRPAGQLRPGFVYRYAPRGLLRAEMEKPPAPRVLFLALLIFSVVMLMISLQSAWVAGGFLVFYTLSVLVLKLRERHWYSAVDDEIEVHPKGFRVRRRESVREYDRVTKRPSGKIGSRALGGYSFTLLGRRGTYSFDPRFLEQCEELGDQTDLVNSPVVSDC